MHSSLNITGYKGVIDRYILAVPECILGQHSGIVDFHIFHPVKGIISCQPDPVNHHVAPVHGKIVTFRNDMVHFNPVAVPQGLACVRHGYPGKLDAVSPSECFRSINGTIFHGNIFSVPDSGASHHMGCGETPAMEFITQIFRKIQTDYPHIHFHIHSGDADAVMERLDKGLLDIGLLLGPMQHEKYDYMSLGKRDIFGLLIPRDCPLAEKPAVSLDDLQDIPLIFPEQTYSGHQRLEWFGADYDSLNIAATYNLIYNATFMVEQGIGYAFCLGNLVNTEGNRNLTFRPFSPPLTVDLFIVTKKYQTFSPAAKVFLNRLREELGK